MKRVLFILVTFLFSFHFSYGQDFIGSGNTPVTILTSDNAGDSHGDRVLDGSGLNAKKYEASRFLSQASFVYNEGDIDAVELSGLDFELWIDTEIGKTYNTADNMEVKLDDIYIEASDLFYANGGTGEYYGPSDLHFNYTWWDYTMKTDAQLRQRVAFALSEIFVISGDSDLGAFGEGLAVFYDILQEHGFGNYKDLLLDVTLNPCMGHYLSHLNNRKTQVINGNQIRPDENYAREIMQLFSIGLYMLNNDGTYELDGAGDPIPTYDQDDIKEFAKVFTGLKGSDWDDDSNESGVPGFGWGIYSISKRVAMSMHAPQHEPGIKYLLNGATTNSDGMTDISNAVDNLFNHQNVGPFIARRLIQRLVKSNPSPAYINRVANAFNDNGSGVRGDIAAVVKQILMDDEARLGSYQNGANSGMLKEPMVKFAQVVGWLDKDNPSGNFWNNGFGFASGTNQHVMQAPSVFNFFVPDFIPNNELNGLYSPEFQIFNTRTSINWINYVHRWAIWNTLFWDWEGDYTENVDVDMTNYEIQAANIEEYMNKLDLLLTAGSLTDFTRQEIRTALEGYSNNDYNRARLGLYLTLISPEFSILH